jgi:hypothetical protein
MIRWPFAILSAMSLLLCIAMAVKWAHSYGNGELLRYEGQARLFVGSANGVICIIWGKGPHDTQAPSEWIGGIWPFSPKHTSVYFANNLKKNTTLGFKVLRLNRQNSVMDGYAVIFPYWIMVVCFFAISAAFTRLYIKQRRLHWRAQNGRCLSCGYDVRETPNRCPECGSDVEKSADVNRGRNYRSAHQRHLDSMP